MDRLEKAVIKTIAYYEALGQYPLTIIEICHYLQKEGLDQCRPTLNQVLRLLKVSLILKQYLDTTNGFFFLKNEFNFYQQRISRQKIAIAKWRKIRRIATYLAFTPYLRGLAVSGSLSLNNAKPQSDLDFLIFTKEGRIWTCRTFLGILLQLIGQRRHDQSVEGKVCLNQFIAQGHFEMEFQNISNPYLTISNAHLYSRLVPLTDYENYRLFLKNNRWISCALFFYPYLKDNNLHLLNKQGWLLKIGLLGAGFLELILDNSLSNYLEKKLAVWQTNRIQKKLGPNRPKQNELYLSDTLLLFHYPICKNDEAAKAYRNKINILAFDN